MFRSLCVLGFIAIVFTGTCFSQDLRGTTEDGRKVILKDDGTWKFSDLPPPSPESAGNVYRKPAAATTLFNAKGGKFSVWFDPATWRQKSGDLDNKTVFEHKDGDIYAMVLAERFGMPIESLKEMAIRNARNAAPDLKVTYEENRVVNGKNVLCMKMEGTIEGIPFIYYGYYYADSGGIIQLITYTSQNLFPQYEGEMTKFLDGLVVNE